MIADHVLRRALFSETGVGCNTGQSDQTWQKDVETLTAGRLMLVTERGMGLRAPPARWSEHYLIWLPSVALLYTK